MKDEGGRMKDEDGRMKDEGGRMKDECRMTNEKEQLAGFFSSCPLCPLCPLCPFIQGEKL
jgi:hypothetical protein